MADYLVKDTDMTVVADAIRTKGGTSEPLTFPDGMAQAVEAISGGGENWLKYANNIGIVGVDKLDETMTVDAKGINRLTFEESGSNVRHWVINNGDGLEDISRCFYHETTIVNNVESITFNFDTRHIKDYGHTFRNIGKPATADGVTLNGTLNVANDANLFAAFEYFYGLKEIRFAPDCLNQDLWFGECSLLSNESVESIIAGLKDLTALDPHTIWINSTVRNRMSLEQKQAISSKNWTLA